MKMQERKDLTFLRKLQKATDDRYERDTQCLKFLKRAAKFAKEGLWKGSPCELLVLGASNRLHLPKYPYTQLWHGVASFVKYWDSGMTGKAENEQYILSVDFKKLQKFTLPPKKNHYEEKFRRAQET